MPEIPFGVLQGMQNRPRVQGKEMQGMQNFVRDSVHNSARYAKTRQNSGHKNAGYAKPSPRFNLDFCRGCNEGFRVQVVIPQWGMICQRFRADFTTEGG
jgi:hypothetical protein